MTLAIGKFPDLHVDINEIKIKHISQKKRNNFYYYMSNK